MKFDPLTLAPFVARLYRLWARLLRYDDPGGKWRAVRAAQAAGTPVVLALWHNELFALAGYGLYRGLSCVTVVSQSQDGEFIARVLERLGHATARGSSSRGGARALMTCIREMKRNRRIGVFTVDGPRGPRHEVKDGVIYAAHRAGALIFPLRALSQRRFVFTKSWDRFELPWPFTRCRVLVGEPYRITVKTLDAAALARERRRLKERLETLGMG
jgi:hypothetical protein